MSCVWYSVVDTFLDLKFKLLTPVVSCCLVFLDYSNSNANHKINFFHLLIFFKAHYINIKKRFTQRTITKQSQDKTQL